MTFILGLTGGIATGKSTVSRYLKQKSIPVVDADIGARKVVEVGTTGLNRIVTAFGSDFLLADGTLHRQKLGSIIFADDQKRELLNDLLRDEIRAWINSETENLRKENHPMIVWDIPLLFEAGYEAFCDAVMVVYTKPDTQLERLMLRNRFTKEEAQNRIDSQMPIDEKKERADVVIDNSGTLEETFHQVDEWLQLAHYQ